MPDLGDARQQLDLAEQAALAGDLSAAREFLTSALRIQEAELGAPHPDVISTLSNLAVIAERTGRNDEAEAGYRRTAALAASSLPPGHEMVVESRRNLEAFCREHGLDARPPRAAPPASREPTRIEPRVENHPPAANPTARERSRPAQQRSSGPLLWLGIAAVILSAVVILQIARQGPATGEVSTSQATTIQTAAPEPVTSPSPAIETPPPAPVATESLEQASPAAAPPAAISAAPSGSGASIVTAELCQKFSTSSGANWQCDPARNPAAEGSMVMYTRIKSARDGSVLHRWYRGDALRQSVRLTTRANASEGYRTYSRQTVNAGDWRVDVRSTDGALLYEQSFSVR